MSTTTLVSLGAPKLEEMDLSATPTPNRGSLDLPEKDVEKLAEEQHNEEDDPEPLSTLRTSLLIMGLTLSIFLVALDFVFPLSQ
jgi:uncharacterized membrane protein